MLEQEKLQRKEHNMKAMVRVCHHCGGLLRQYRGSLTCLMCGRDVDHECQNCRSDAGILYNTA